MSAAKLPYLIDEICAAVEIYFTGWTGGQYRKTAFILCDDYTELTAKLFLLVDDSKWSDKKANGRFKGYKDILDDVEGVFTAARATDLGPLQGIHANMKNRRDRRNEFFHSTHLLDLSAGQRSVVEAFCDLFTYGDLLFGTDWQRHVDSSRNLDTMRILLLIEKASFSDPTIRASVAAILRDFPRNRTNATRKGVHVTEYPEDFHLRICIMYGTNKLRDKLKALLPMPGGGGHEYEQEEEKCDRPQRAAAEDMMSIHHKTQPDMGNKSWAIID